MMQRYRSLKHVYAWEIAHPVFPALFPYVDAIKTAEVSIFNFHQIFVTSSSQDSFKQIETTQL